MLSAPLRDALLKVYDLIYQTAAMSLYNGSVTDENTLQSFKEQQVGVNAFRDKYHKQSYDHLTQNYLKTINWQFTFVHKFINNNKICIYPF